MPRHFVPRNDEKLIVNLVCYIENSSESYEVEAEEVQATTQQEALLNKAMIKAKDQAATELWIDDSSYASDKRGFEPLSDTIIQEIIDGTSNLADQTFKHRTAAVSVLEQLRVALHTKVKTSELTEADAFDIYKKEVTEFRDSKNEHSQSPQKVGQVKMSHVSSELTDQQQDMFFNNVIS